MSDRRKQFRTYVKEGADAIILKQKLVKADRETSVSFYDVSCRIAEITTANVKWQNRLESLGIIPVSLTRFEGDKAEIRYYDKVPLNLIKLPANGRRGAKKVRDKKLSAKEWKKEGVAVYHISDYTIDSGERETCIHFCETDKKAWILTSQNKWQNRIESLGVSPYIIYTYKATRVEAREYMVPINFIKLPSSGKRVKKE